MSAPVTFDGRPVRGIVFDKDGTLFDFRATWTAWAQTFLLGLAEGDRNKAHHLGQAIGFDTVSGDYHPQSPVIAGTPAEIADFLLPHLPGHDFVGLVRFMNLAAAEAPMAEAAPLVPLFQDLGRLGLRLGVATNDAEEPALAHLDAVGALELLDFVAGSDSGHGAKPEAGQLLAFARAAGLATEEVMMIGDSQHDLIAGRAAGMMTIGVLTGPARKSDLADLADRVIENIGELPEIFDIRGT